MRIIILLVFLFSVSALHSTELPKDRATFKALMKPMIADNVYAYKNCISDINVLCARAAEGQTFGEFHDEGDNHGSGKLPWDKFLELNELSKETKRTDKVTAETIYARSISNTGARKQKELNESMDNGASTEESNAEEMQESE